MKTRRVSYRGVEIERSPGGWYVAFIPDHGYLKADTAAGVRELISAALGGRSRTSSRMTRAGDRRPDRVPGARRVRQEAWYRYYTLIVPSVRRGRTQWHPTERTGPFETIQRGAFPTQRAAHHWARLHLGGKHYRVKTVWGVREPAQESRESRGEPLVEEARKRVRSRSVERSRRRA